MIVGCVVTGLVGIVMLVLGWLLWKKEKLSLLHDYHYDKVSEENKAAFCALSGIGLLLGGIGLVVSAVLLIITDSAWSFLAFAIGFGAGLALMLLASHKYNR